MRNSLRNTATLTGLLFLTVSAIYLSAYAGPLQDAARSGDVVSVGQLIADGADVNGTDPGFNTALHWAADNGHLEVARVLIEKGADINARDIDGTTPLKRAVWEKHSDTVRFLIARGADVNLLDSTGIGPLDEAVRLGLADIITMLKGADAKCGTNHEFSRNCKEAEGQN